MTTTIIETSTVRLSSSRKTSVARFIITLVGAVNTYNVQHIPLM